MHRRMQEKHLIRKKKIYLAFVDLEKAFDRVPRSVLWWNMRKLGIDEWIVRLVKVSTIVQTQEQGKTAVSVRGLK